jgi:hypothetical protein
MITASRIASRLPISITTRGRHPGALQRVVERLARGRPFLAHDHVLASSSRCGCRASRETVRAMHEDHDRMAAVRHRMERGSLVNCARTATSVR